MSPFYLFVIRFILSVTFAFIISRFFFQSLPVYKVFGVALIMLGLAYVSEYFRKRNEKKRQKN